MIIFEERSPILDQSEYRKQIKKKTIDAQKELVVISAFVKIIGLKWLETIIPKNIKVTLISRFSPQDILMGSSDLEIYEICKKNNWKFKFITELHAKVILIDRSHLFVGSQNLTGKGMGIVCNPNLEYGMMTIPTKEEVKIINSIVDQSLEMNDYIFEEYEKWLSDKKQNFILPSFKDNPLKKYQVFDFKNIWCKDFPKINFEEFISNFSKSNQIITDIKEIFSIDQLITKDNFLENYDSFIMSSKIFNWIKKQANENDNQLFFGKISSLIHDSVRDDPTPNRKLVKDLQANFYSFLKKMSKEIVNIDVPHTRSERIVFNI